MEIFIIKMKQTIKEKDFLDKVFGYLIILQVLFAFTGYTIDKLNGFKFYFTIIGIMIWIWFFIFEFPRNYLKLKDCQ